MRSPSASGRREHAGSPRPAEQIARSRIARTSTRLGEPDRDVDRDDRVVVQELEHGREVAGDARLVLAWHMLQWGRTTRQKAFSAAVVEAVFRRENGLPVTVDPPMSSGWTQVAALATDDLEGDPRHAPHVIWDSRVSTSLVFRLDKLMVDREGQDFQGGLPADRSRAGQGRIAQGGGPRHPSRLRLRWSHVYGHLPAQDAGSKLVRELQDGLNGGDYGLKPTSPGHSASSTVRGVESALLMGGY